MILCGDAMTTQMEIDRSMEQDEELIGWMMERFGFSFDEVAEMLGCTEQKIAQVRKAMQAHGRMNE